MGSKMDAYMAETKKRVKDDIISKGLREFSRSKIPFSSPRMNYCTYGGVPVGHITEFFGIEHGGKTTSALDIVKNFQAIERKKKETAPDYVEKDVLYCDCENTLDLEWAQKLGVDVDKMYDLHPNAQSAEEIFNMIEDIIKLGEFGLIVIDSIAAMVSQDELEKGYDEKSFGGISASLSRFSKKMEGLCSQYKCTLIGINQVRDDVNSSWGGYKTPGGRAWKHLCIARFEFRKGKYIDEKGNELTNNAETPAGNLVMFSMVKNKTCPPNRKTGFYTLKYDTGIDYLADLIEVAIKYDIISKSGAWFTIPGVKDKIQGQAGVHKYLAEHDNIRAKVEEVVDANISK